MRSLTRGNTSKIVEERYIEYESHNDGLSSRERIGETRRLINEKTTGTSNYVTESDDDDNSHEYELSDDDGDDGEYDSISLSDTSSNLTERLKSREQRVRERRSMETLRLEQQYPELKTIFDQFDIDGNGTISPQELGTAVRSFGMDITQERVDRIFQLADKNRDGEIDFYEFARLMNDHVLSNVDLYISDERIVEELMLCFSIFDRDGDGSITTEELKYSFMKLSNPTSGAAITESELQRIMGIADKNGDGVIDCDEFADLVQNSSELRALIRKVMTPSPLDYLRSFAMMPSSFRKSLLVQLMKEGSHNSSMFVKPLMCESGLYMQDLMIDSKSGEILPVYVNTFTISLSIARGIPIPSRLREVEILERRVYMCLFDKSSFLSNVFFVDSTWDSRREDEWRFRENDPENNIFVRTYHKNIELSLFFEFVILVRNIDKNGREVIDEISCGWTMLPLFKEDYKIRKTSELFVTGGTPFAPVEIDKIDISLRRKNMFDRIQMAINGHPNPSLQVRVQKLMSEKDQIRFSQCPVNMINVCAATRLLSIFRSLLAKELLVVKAEHPACSVVADPILTQFPKIMDNDEVWRIMWRTWADRYNNLNKRKKRDESTLRTLLTELVTEMWCVMTCVNLPDRQYGQVKEVKDRNLWIQHATERPLEQLCQSEINLFTPFDVQETVDEFML